MLKRLHVPTSTLRRIALAVAVIAGLASGIWLTQSAVTTGPVVAQTDTNAATETSTDVSTDVSTDTMADTVADTVADTDAPAVVETPVAGRGEGRPGQNGEARPEGWTPGARPQPDAEAPIEGAAAANRVEATGTVTSTSTTLIGGIVAIAGVDGAPLSGAPEGDMLYTVDVGTAMQATGRSDDGKWLYVENEAVVKNGQEVEVAFAGWTPQSAVIAFSIDALPVVDATTTAIVIPGSAPEPAPRLVDADDADDADAPNAVNAPAQVGRAPAQNADDVVVLAGDTDDVTNAATDLAADPMTAGENMNVAGVVNLDSARLNVRSGPEVDTAILGKLYPDDSVLLLGRNADGTWLLLAGGADNIVGWVSAEFISSTAAIDALPIVPASRAPVDAASLQTVSAASTARDMTAATVSDTRRAASAVSTVSGAGDVIVFQTNPGGTIYAYNLVSGTLQPLTNGFDPAISPNGQTVAFTRDGGESGLYLIDSNGSNERLIFGERSGLAAPKWSPDGNWLVFSRNDTYAECYRMGAACVSESVILERNANADLSDYELVKEPRYHLAMVDAHGDNYTDIAALDTARAPDWIDAGIVYQSSAGIQITDATEDAENQLVIFDKLKPFFHDPDWQPNQENGWGKIVYMGKEDSHWELFTVNPDGTGVTALTRPETTLVDVLPSNVAPVWSPDGTQILFLSNREENGEAGVWRIWIMDADGNNQQPLGIDIDIDYTFGDEQAISW